MQDKEKQKLVEEVLDEYAQSFKHPETEKDFLSWNKYVKWLDMEFLGFEEGDMRDIAKLAIDLAYEKRKEDGRMKVLKELKDADDNKEILKIKQREMNKLIVEMVGKEEEIKEKYEQSLGELLELTILMTRKQTSKRVADKLEKLINPEIEICNMRKLRELIKELKGAEKDE